MNFFSLVKTLLKSLFGKPATVRHPFVKREAYGNTRGQVVIDIDKCIYCTLCQKKCPTGAIVVNRDAKTWEIQRMKCIVCGACVDACPKKCLKLGNQYSAPYVKKVKETYQCTNTTSSNPQ